MAESVSKPHRLIITETPERNPLTDEPWREWEVVHPDDCPKIEEKVLNGITFFDYDCMVSHETSHAGLDSLYPEWTTLAAGEYEIEAFSNYDPYTMEWDGGLRLTEEED